MHTQNPFALQELTIVIHALKKYYYYIFSFLIFVAVTDVVAQTESFRFSHLTIENGLPDNLIRDMHIGKKGFLWIGTNKGLSRYDGYAFKNFSFIQGDTTSLSGNIIKSIHEDSDGFLWLGTVGGGLNRFDPTTETFSAYEYVIENPYNEGLDVTSIIDDDEGNLWIGTFSCGLQYFDKKTEKFSRFNLRKNYEASEGFQKNSIHSLVQDVGDKNKIWIGGSQGLFLFDKKTKTIKNVPIEVNGIKDSTTSIMSLFMEKPNELLVGTWRLGIGVLDIANENWKLLVPDRKAFDEGSKYSNIIDEIERKSSDELWVCSRDQGLMIWNEKNEEFVKIKNNPTDPFSIRSNKVNGIFQDAKNRVWVYNHENGISFLDPTNQFFQYYPLFQSRICDEKEAKVFDITIDERTGNIFVTTIGCEALFVFNKEKKLIQSLLLNPEEPESEDGFHVVAARNGSVWLAGGNEVKTVSSLFKYDFTNNSLSKFSHPQLQQIPIHNYKLNDIIEDDYGNIWIASKFGGLIKINSQTDDIQQFVKKEPSDNSIDTRTELSQLKIAKNGIIWIATLQEGVLAFDPKTEKIKRFSTSDNRELGLRGKRIITIEEDKHENIWVGLSATGIQIIDPKKENWMIGSFNANNGLPNEEIWNIQKDSEENIWLSTQYGLCKFDEVNNVFIQYTQLDGIKDPVIKNKGFELVKDGSILIGQRNEFCSFSPKNMMTEELSSNIVFSSLTVLEKEYPLEKDLNYLDEIELNYDENFFTIGFSTLKFSDVQKNRYAFKLEGYDNDWIYHDGKRNFATYTKVAPGSYSFLVKAVNQLDISDENQLRINIVIKPPFWKTWWAYLAYLIIGVATIWWFIQFQINKNLIRQEAIRLKELNEAKTKLFNNITHELRTPLTVVLGSVDRARRLQRSLTTDELKMVKQNGEHLLKLINQVLDLGKLDANAMPLDNNWEDIIGYLKYVTNSFETLADEKSIQLIFESNPSSCNAFFDKEKFSIIISNLLSNALKFTPIGGTITVFIKIKERDHPEESYDNNMDLGISKSLIIQVHDTGIGIPESKLPLIFDRFYQVSAEKSNPNIMTQPSKGTGIGLSLTKELVTLMNGKIEVKSQPDKGTNFILEIPIMVQQGVPEVKTEAISDDQPVVLLIEDNPSLVQYVSSGLNPHFQLLIENDGKAGLERAKEAIPDIVVSDVMMPEMDGFEFCQKLKKDNLTSHIPVILLTAKVGQEAKMEGLQSGADAYLTKPFDEEELIIRIKNLIERRENLRSFYLQKSGLSKEIGNPKNSIPNKGNELDNVFLEKVKSVMESQLDDPSFSIAALSKIIGLSHTQLHRKVVALTGQPPIKLIKTLRHNKAKELLLTTSLTISEIAYQIGFTDPSYFSKSFKSELGHSPKEFRKKMR